MNPDPALPGSEVLLAADAVDVLAPAIAAAGGRLLSARPSQIRYRPGRRLAVRFGAEVEWADGSRRTETLGALVQTAPLPEGLAVIEREDGARVGVWRYPHDPFLPGLPLAAYPNGARQVLRRLGLDVGDVRVEPLVYRPATRAVLRVTAPGRCVYFKVVRPGEAAPLRGLHDALRPHAPVPTCLGASDPLGVVVLEALDGLPLTRPLVEGGHLPAAEAVLDVAGAIAAVDVASDAAAGLTADHAGLLRHAVPDAGARITRLADAAADLGTPADRTVHGDFYEAQVLVSEGAISGLLDVDGVRHGSALDDPATLIGHLVALAHVHPHAGDAIGSYRRDIERVACRAVDRQALHPAVTGVLLGLATTSFRRQEPDWRRRTLAWLSLAERWADRPPARLGT